MAQTPSGAKDGKEGMPAARGGGLTAESRPVWRLVMLLALPHISASLGADSTQTLWIMDIYGFMLAGFMITMGTLADRIGLRKLLLIGATSFGTSEPSY